jgi:hypothetical protein
MIDVAGRLLENAFVSYSHRYLLRLTLTRICLSSSWYGRCYCSFVRAKQFHVHGVGAYSIYMTGLESKLLPEMARIRGMEQRRLVELEREACLQSML